MPKPPPTTQQDAIDAILKQWSLERPDLDTSALAVIVRVLTLHKAFLKLADTALAEVGLEMWEYDVLSALRRQGEPFSLATTELARATSLSPGAMTNRIDKLTGRKLTRRAADPGDRRGVIVTLTALGKRVIDQAIQLRLEAADRGLEGLSRSERSTLAALLRKAVLGVQPPGDATED